MMETLSAEVGSTLSEQRLILVTAESCTGGGISSSITDIAGSSSWFDRAFVTYSNEAKMEMLGVRRTTLDEFGAVSEQTALEMVQGALANSLASIGVSVTGIAGPGGAVPGKSVGTVCFAVMQQGKNPTAFTFRFEGDRRQVREQAVQKALQLLMASMKNELNS